MAYETKEHEQVALGIVAAVSGIFGGFLLGWFANDDSTARIYCTFITILLLVALSKAWKEFKLSVVTHSELHRAHRADEEVLAQKQEKAALAQVKAMKETAKSEIEYLFTSEDFDEQSQALLDKIVMQARKKKIRVTGEGLLTSILKGIR